MSILLALILIVALIVAGLVLFAANTARKVEATVPPCGQFVKIDGQRLHYLDTGGTGPAIVSRLTGPAPAIRRAPTMHRRGLGRRPIRWRSSYARWV
jgi:hypothetical protein